MYARFPVNDIFIMLSSLVVISLKVYVRLIVFRKFRIFENFKVLTNSQNFWLYNFSFVLFWQTIAFVFRFVA